MRLAVHDDVDRSSLVAAHGVEPSVGHLHAAGRQWQRSHCLIAVRRTDGYLQVGPLRVVGCNKLRPLLERHCKRATNGRHLGSPDLGVLGRIPGWGQDERDRTRCCVAAENRGGPSAWWPADRPERQRKSWGVLVAGLHMPVVLHRLAWWQAHHASCQFQFYLAGRGIRQQQPGPEGHNLALGPKDLLGSDVVSLHAVHKRPAPSPPRKYTPARWHPEGKRLGTLLCRVHHELAVLLRTLRGQQRDALEPGQRAAPVTKLELKRCRQAGALHKPTRAAQPQLEPAQRLH
mmetsp:Transcript_76660/g.216932  ORF Transcript_76660/g.216932 Transcript_76660/m.216932 type:complete len:289 (-) Transcript_76660:1240-2106(-)